MIFIDGLDTYHIAGALKRRYFSNINPSEVLRLGPRTNLVIAVPGVDIKEDDNNKMCVIGD